MSKLHVSFLATRLLPAALLCGGICGPAAAANGRDSSRRRGVEPLVPRPIPSRPLPATPRLWPGVEDAVDRGNGRVTNEPTYQVDRSRRRADERLGRVRSEREFERFQDEYDRRWRLDRQRPRPTGLTPRDITSPPRIEPSNVGISWMLESDERRLQTLKAEYDTALRSAVSQRDRAMAAEPTELGRAAAQRNFEANHSRLTRAYEARRQAILGRPPRE